jgi:aspartate carbamoyltransferase regulatory subunit
MGRPGAPKHGAAAATRPVQQARAAQEAAAATELAGGVELKKDVKLQVSALRSGTVIDHLGPRTALKALRLLGVGDDATVLLGINLDSRKLGRKDLIKIEGRELTQDEIDKIALLSPQATFSIIRNYEVVKKFRPELPAVVEGLIRCVNPACITRDPRVKGRFLTVRKDPLKLRCYFCERSLHEDEIEFL